MSEVLMTADRKSGTVVSWKKTYGFVKIDGSTAEERELFVYHEHINMPGFKILKSGDRVNFLIGKNHMGPMAVDVQFIIDTDFNANI